MYCSKCGKEIDNNSLFCAFCGNELNNEKQPLYDLRPKKTAWQALLLYLSALGIQFLSLIILATLVILIMQTLGIKISIPELKAQAKKYGVILNPVFAMIFSCLIMQAKNLFNQKRAIIFTIISVIITFLIGSVAGFIFVAIMTRFKPQEISGIQQNS